MNDDLKFTPFTEAIFYGAGEQEYKRNQRELKRQIKLLQSLNSGRQQPCHCETDEDHKKCTAFCEKMEAVRCKLAERITKALDI